MNSTLPLIAISLGDPNGIGPEVALKAALDGRVREKARVALMGPRIAWKERGLHQIEEIPTFEAFEDIGSEVLFCIVDAREGRVGLDAAGEVSAEAGRMAMQSVEFAVRACLSGAADALVTAPISKEAIRLAGYPFPGHTEFLAKLTETDDVVMVLATNRLDVGGSAMRDRRSRPRGGTPLRVALATIHIPVSRVAEALSMEGLATTLSILTDGLIHRFGVEDPEIAVLGLNPHAGEGGVIGGEELDIIEPAMEEARRAGIKVTGPHSADAFFGQRKWKEVDAVLAMYHDQGLAPFKALAMGEGVNVTLGLPIIRTSPDHGTAFDIAGKGIADPSSMIEAILLAVRAIKSGR